MRDAWKRVLGELREVQHRDLAVLLLHLLARHSTVAAALARSGRPRSASRATALSRRRSCGVCGPGGPALARAAAPTASAARPRLEELAQRIGARSDAEEPLLLGENTPLRRRAGHHDRRAACQGHAGSRQTCTRGLYERASIKMEISVVAAHGFSPGFMPANQSGRYLSLFVDQTSMRALRARPAALPVIGRKGWRRAVAIA